MVTAFFSSVKRTIEDSSLMSVLPSTDYRRHVPKSAEQLMRDNWRKTGKSLYRAMKKVEEDEKQ